LEKKKICLVTSGHPPFDDRIFWKFGNSIKNAGYDVSIICSTQSIIKEVNGINIIGFDSSVFTPKKKISHFKNLIDSINPNLIICEEMLPAFAAINIRKRNTYIKVILDITEWYPENVALKLNGLKKWIKYFQLLLPYIFILNKVDHLILGEITKLKRYNFLAPFKQKTIIGYYPVLKYFNYKQPDLTKDNIVFGYAGVITFERGIINFFNALYSLADKYPQKSFTFLLFGKFTYPEEEKKIKQILSNQNKIKIEFEDWTGYDKMSSIIEKMDICFDLRKRNFIYSNSLPIKIFEYMACGKPFIYSDIIPIKKELKYDKLGYLVNPENEIEIINAIKKYLGKPEIAVQHSLNARKLIEDKKNWENESKKLITLLNNLLR
jgi:glycosyltransferase involved in cell wall biosynthesis